MTLSREIFRQYDIRGIVGRDLTTDVATAVGLAYAELMRERRISGDVVVSRDNRPSGEALSAALIDALRSGGTGVVDIGIVPTPVNYWTQHHLPVAGGIQITGSHNPPEYNGFKLSLNRGSLHGADIDELYAIASGTASGGNRGSRGALYAEDVLDRYVADIVRLGGRPERPMRVVFDCGNGAASIVAPRLFRDLGRHVTARGLFCESDGTFPNHHPDPTVPENLADLIEAVLADRAEIGIAFDGDGDRIGIVDERGTIIWADRVLILFARDVLARTGRDQSIIFDVKCSQVLPDAIAAAGGNPVMWKTGHSLIKERMKESNAPLAGEMSGHMFFSEGFYGHDDALYAAVRLLRILSSSGQSVREALSDVPDLVSTPELRIDVPEHIKFEIVQRAVAHFRERYPIVDVDGVRVLFGDGWGLIRASNTQPVIVARYEAETAGRLSAIRGEMETWLRTQGVQV